EPGKGHERGAPGPVTAPGVAATAPEHKAGPGVAHAPPAPPTAAPAHEPPTSARPGRFEASREPPPNAVHGPMRMGPHPQAAHTPPPAPKVPPPPMHEPPHPAPPPHVIRAPPPLSRARPRRRRLRRALRRQRVARRARTRSINDRERRAEITPAATAHAGAFAPDDTGTNRAPCGLGQQRLFHPRPAMFLRHD